MRQFVARDVCSIVPQPPFTDLSVFPYRSGDSRRLYWRVIKSPTSHVACEHIGVSFITGSDFDGVIFSFVVLSGVVRPIPVDTTKSATVSVSLCSAWVTCSTATCMNRQTHRHASISSPPVRFSRCCVIIKAWVHSYVKIRRMHSITGYSFKVEYRCNIHILLSIAHCMKIQ